MGTDESQKLPEPYGWFNQKRAELLGEFLHLQVIQDPDVDELIIAGDLFDEWVVPRDADPVPSPAASGSSPSKLQLEKIANATINQRVMSALKEIAISSKTLTYVPGNHDMLLNEIGRAHV